MVQSPSSSANFCCGESGPVEGEGHWLELLPTASSTWFLYCSNSSGVTNKRNSIIWRNTASRVFISSILTPPTLA